MVQANLELLSKTWRSNLLSKFKTNGQVVWDTRSSSLTHSPKSIFRPLWSFDLFDLSTRSSSSNEIPRRKFSNISIQPSFFLFSRNRWLAKKISSRANQAETKALNSQSSLPRGVNQPWIRSVSLAKPLTPGWLLSSLKTLQMPKKMLKMSSFKFEVHLPPMHTRQVMHYSTST